MIVGISMNALRFLEFAPTGNASTCKDRSGVIVTMDTNQVMIARAASVYNRKGRKQLVSTLVQFQINAKDSAIDN